MRRIGESLVTTFEEKVNALRKTFFPPLSQTDISDILEVVYSSPLSMSNQITKEEICKAIFRSKSDKASGIDGLPNRFLRLVTEKLLSKFRHLFQTCVDVGYHPKEFRKANIIVLRKPKKEDYFESKSYRLITLLSTLRKTLKIVIARRLSDCAEDNDLLSLKQMRVRRKRFTKIALETIIDAVHTVWDCEKNKVASLLSLDMTGAFDNVFHYRLLHNLRQKGISKLIMNWTRSFLIDREISLTLKRITSRLKPAETGIPQGSSMSSILFLFFNASLIERCTKIKLKLQVKEFVDDIHLLTYEKSTKTNCETLKKAHEICL